MTQKSISITERKELGIFYTPAKLTKILCNWAIKEGDDLIFEPSFGGCGFLEASCDRLQDLNNCNPVQQLYGCDIDENAFQNYLHPLYKDIDPLIDRRFLKGNFLNLSPIDFSVPHFSAVVGNPPYISYHKMSDTQRVSVFETAKNMKIKLDKRASLWAYFVLHSLKFLKEGGRLALVLPGSFLQSNYAKIIRDKITSCFESSLIIQIGERLFSSEGTDENTSILLAEGFGAHILNSSMKIDFVSKLDDLESKIVNYKKDNTVLQTTSQRTSYELISKLSSNSFQEIQNNYPIKDLGEIADISIGIVTGANDFFIINEEKLNELNIPLEYIVPIFSKFRMTNGIEFTIDDCNSKRAENFPCLFVDTLGKQRIRDKNLKTYLDSFPKDRKQHNVTFKKRPIWHSPLYRKIPDAFFPYMHNSGPRIILNSAKTLSTNTIHRVFFKDNNERKITLAEKRILAISILSTFSQFSAELEGRTYGSGALKIEPSEAKRIKLIIPSNIDEEFVGAKFDEMDKLLRDTAYQKQSDSKVNDLVRHKADQFIVETINDSNLSKVLSDLSEELKKSRLRRKRW